MTGGYPTGQYMVEYPSPTHRLFLRNSKTNQQARHNLQPRVVKTVDMTDKISKWQLEKRPKVFLLQNARHTSIDRQDWNISFAFTDFSIIRQNS